MASYRAAGLDLRIGRRSRGLDGVLHGMNTRQAVLITACNPRSRRRPKAAPAPGAKRNSWLRAPKPGLPA